MREYRTLNALRRGETVDLGGIRVKMDVGEICPGDLYVAERNNAAELLTAREIVMTACGRRINYVVPTTLDYCFEGHECVKVREA